MGERAGYFTSHDDDHDHGWTGSEARAAENMRAGLRRGAAEREALDRLPRCQWRDFGPGGGARSCDAPGEIEDPEGPRVVCRSHAAARARLTELRARDRRQAEARAARLRGLG